MYDWKQVLKHETRVRECSRDLSMKGSLENTIRSRVVVRGGVKTAIDLVPEQVRP